jgi:exopolysaccharide biosynthesis polyprenyl glycosylphosphotransferase
MSDTTQSRRGADPSRPSSPKFRRIDLVEALEGYVPTPRASRVPDDVNGGTSAAELPAVVEQPLVDWANEGTWQHRLAVRALVGDALIGVLFTVLIELRNGVVIPAAVVSLVAWPAAIWASRGYEYKFLGVGPEEFRRIAMAGLSLLCAVSVAGVLLKWQSSRGVVLCLIAATVVTLLWRYVLRRMLHRERRHGKNMHRVLAVGHELAVEELVRELRRDSHHGLDVIGACIPGGPAKAHPGTLAAEMAIGSFDNIDRVVADYGVDTVAVLSCPEMDYQAFRRLVWALEPRNVDLLVAPGTIEVTGPRLSVRPAAGLPLLHLEAPELGGGRRLLKACGDRISAVLGIIFLLPVFAAIALAVRIDSAGPIVFRQSRVGLDGQEFTMFKFRSMHADAEARLAEIAHLDEHGTGQLFKVKNDPRITRVGAFIRRYSLDELPQLFNVVFGEMSLVGPRPPLPREVAAYSEVAMPRLKVKPGLTGLWQVSGRSDLSVEESVRLDLRYVENWSLAMDAMILWKTARAVLGKSGAY